LFKISTSTTDVNSVEIPDPTTQEYSIMLDYLSTLYQLQKL